MERWSAGAQQIPSYTLTVTSLSPIWFYCTSLSTSSSFVLLSKFKFGLTLTTVNVDGIGAQGQHCQAGMVGAINAPQTGNTFDAFAANAKSATKVTAPVALAPSGVGANQLGSISSVPVAIPTAVVASGSVSGSPALTAGGDPPTSYSTAVRLLLDFKGTTS